MNVSSGGVSLNNICEGCLSTSRVLRTELRPEVKKYFQDILESFDCFYNAEHSKHPLALCWECEALIKRTLKYTRQVQHAHQLLNNYVSNNSTPLPQLSTLSTHKLQPEIIINHDPPDPTKTTLKQEIDNIVKVEIENDDDHFGDTGFCEDDVCDQKVVLKTDSISKEDSAKRKRSKKKIDADFEESHEILKKTEDKKKCVEVEIHIESKSKSIRKKKASSNSLRLKPKLNQKEVKRKKRRKKESDSELDSDDEPLKKRTEDTLQKLEEVDVPMEYERTKKGAKNKKVGSREYSSGVVSNGRVLRKLQQLNVDQGTLEMIVLTWEQVEEERQKALSSESFTRHTYRCDSCALGFNHRMKLDNHMTKHDPGRGAFKCEACGIHCRDAHSLCAHRRRHRVRWRCTICGELSSRAEVAADHVTRAHAAAAPTHACRHCEYVAPTLAKLRHHLKSHGEKQNCELCGKSFNDRASLRTHLFIHKGEKEFTCPECDKRFLFKKAMEVHLITHEPPALLYCQPCDMNFKNRLSYYQHIRYNLKHIDPAMLKYACSLCDKKFAKPARLQEHVVAVHLKATPVRCTMPDCNFACASRPVLRTHMRMTHRSLKLVRNHVCHTCGKAYLTKKCLEGHLRSHSGERPFACPLCPSTFSYQAALYNHTRLKHNRDKVAKRSSRAAPAAPGSAPPAPAVGPWPLPLPLPLPLTLPLPLQ